MIPFVGGSYSLAVRRADVQRTVNMYPVGAEDEGSHAPSYLAQIPGLDVFSDVPAVATEYFLDTFTGTSGITLDAHAPDVAPDGFAWVTIDAERGLQLNGAGAAIQTDLGTVNDSTAAPVSFAAMSLGTAWRIECDSTVINFESGEGAGRTIFVCRTDNDSNGLRVTFDAAADGSSVVAASITGHSITSGALDGITHSAKVVVTPAGFTLIVDDVPIDTVSVDMTNFAAFVGAQIACLGYFGNGAIDRVAVYPQGAPA